MAGLVRFLLWLGVIGGAVGAIVYYGYADVWTLPADDPRFLVAIEPNLRGGDVILVARHGVPDVGQLARCTDPDEPRRWVVGRVVASGGGEVRLHGQTFSTPGSKPSSGGRCPSMKLTNPGNGYEVELNCRIQEFAGTEFDALTAADPEVSMPDDQTVPVPAGHLYLLSDDRYLHLDSRDFGSLPEASCRHVLFRLWGADGFGDGSRRFTALW